jgi:hypothetical protein
LQERLELLLGVRSVLLGSAAAESLALAIPTSVRAAATQLVSAIDWKGLAIDLRLELEPVSLGFAAEAVICPLAGVDPERVLVSLIVFALSLAGTSLADRIRAGA